MRLGRQELPHSYLLARFAIFFIEGAIGWRGQECFFTPCTPPLPLYTCHRARRGASARATDRARKRAFGNRAAAWPELVPDRRGHRYSEGR